MGTSQIQAHDFAKLFEGNTSFYGLYYVDAVQVVEPGKKLKGGAETVKGTVTEEMFYNHLNGIQRLGIVPVTADGHCKFIAMDVDVYSGGHEKLLHCIRSNNMPLIPFYSKSGGLHLYMFFDSMVKAKEARTVMLSFRDLLCLKKSTEIFPKQVVLDPNSKGSWINIPYFDCDSMVQCMIADNGAKLTLDEALVYILTHKVNIPMLTNYLAEVPLSDAPPCLQSIYFTSDTLNRNKYLFNLARYFKSKDPDTWQSQLLLAGARLLDPMPAKELNETVIKSFTKKDYSYACNDAPICDLCNKLECRKRPYGLGGTEISSFDFEELTQYKTDPPYYEWKVNGQIMTFFSENDIISQHAWRTLAFRLLHRLPPRLTEIAWYKIVNNALTTMVVKPVEEGTDISPGALFKEYLTEFFTKRVYAERKEEIIMGKVYKDDKFARYIFKPMDLLVFLIQIRGFRSFGQTEIQDRLRKMGAKPDRFFINNTVKNIRVWSFPYEGLKKFMDEPIDTIDVTFKPIDTLQEYNYSSTPVEQSEICTEADAEAELDALEKNENDYE